MADGSSSDPILHRDKSRAGSLLSALLHDCSNLCEEFLIGRFKASPRDTSDHCYKMNEQLQTRVSLRTCGQRMGRWLLRSSPQGDKKNKEVESSTLSEIAGCAACALRSDFQPCAFLDGTCQEVADSTQHSDKILNS